jgi:hypothetical protein
MSSEASSVRSKGAAFAVAGLCLVAVNWISLHYTNTFYVMPTLLGPIVAAIGFSAVIRPPAEWPPKEVHFIHTAFFGLGLLLGLIHLVLLKYGSFGNFWQRFWHGGN